jgi:hypothetical protein
MNSDNMPRDELQYELRLATERLWAEYRLVGPRRSVSNPTRWQVRINSALFAMIYAFFNVACLILGLTFVFFKGAIQTLGVSLIVGSLFSFGAFVAQFWSAAQQREAQAIDRAFDEGSQDIRYTKIRRFAKDYWELSERVNEGAQPSGHDTSASAT